MDYRTQAGDTLIRIADRYAVSLSDLESANPQIHNPGLIFVNELIHLPVAAHVHKVKTVPPHRVTYVVRVGDTMSQIASAHNTSLAALEAANPQVTNPSVLHPGEVLNIPGSAHSTHTGTITPVSTAASIAVSDVGYTLYQGGGDIEAWTTRACRILNRPADDWIRGYQVLCQRESSGRPNAINNYDANAHGAVQADGYPLHCSRGVAQCIPDTFANYHASGTTGNIYDPVANIAASMQYVMNRYGVSDDGSNLAERVQQADPNRSPAGY
jgi:LysM repeat protein